MKILLVVILCNIFAGFCDAGIDELIGKEQIKGENSVTRFWVDEGVFSVTINLKTSRIVSCDFTGGMNVGGFDNRKIVEVLREKYGDAPNRADLRILDDGFEVRLYKIGIGKEALLAVYKKISKENGWEKKR